MQRTGSGSAAVQLACLAQSYFLHLIGVLQIRSANHLTSSVVLQYGTDAPVLAVSRYAGSGSQQPSSMQLHSVAKPEADMLEYCQEEAAFRVGKGSPVLLRMRRIRRQDFQFEGHECGNPVICQPTHTGASTGQNLTCASECLGPLIRSCINV